MNHQQYGLLIIQGLKNGVKMKGCFGFQKAKESNTWESNLVFAFSLKQTSINLISLNSNSSFKLATICH
jgi:hypothetical protein